MPTTNPDLRHLKRMVAMMLTGFALLAAGVLLNPPKEP